MRIIQEFTQLPSGEQVMTKDNMIVQLKLVDFLQKLQVQRVTEYKDFDFDKLPDRLFKFKGAQRVLANAQMQEEAFWEEHRADSLTKAEGSMDRFIQGFQTDSVDCQGFHRELCGNECRPETAVEGGHRSGEHNDFAKLCGWLPLASLSTDYGEPE